MNDLKVIGDAERISKIESFYRALFQNYLDPLKLKKFYGGQPVSMMPESLIHVTQRRLEDNEFYYNISAKLDGTRMLLMLHPMLEGSTVFIDRSMTYYEPVLPHTYTGTYICLFDGEMYENVFFVFDMIYYNGYVCDYIFEVRLKTIQELLVCNRDKFTDSFVSFFTKNTKIHIIPKLYMEFQGFNDTTSINDFYGFVTSYFSRNPILSTLNLRVPLKFDGLIFTPRFTRYILADNWKYPSNILYKWKPVVHETIDFILEKKLVRVGPNSNKSKRVTVGIVEGHKKQRVVFLTDRQTSTYAIVRHDKCVMIDSNRVYECGYDFKTKQFYIVRERTDKLNKPNSLRTANSVWKLLVYNIDINGIMFLLSHKDVKTIPCIPRWQKESLTLQSIVPLNDSVTRRFNRQNGKKAFINEYEVRVGTRKSTFFDAYVQYKNYRWLFQTLDSMNVSSTFIESVDVFDSDNTRTTYLCGNVVSCIKKYQQDTKEYFLNYMFGYDIRVSVCTEEHVFSEAMKKRISLDEHKKVSGVKYRTKKRKTYNFSQNFQIDITEVTSSEASETIRFQVEIELKPFRYMVDTVELNRVVLFVLQNLYGKSELF